MTPNAALLSSGTLARVGAPGPVSAAPGRVVDAPPIFTDPYVVVQTILAETDNQDLSYLTISEINEPERDLDLTSLETRMTDETGAPLPDITAAGKTLVVQVSGVRVIWDRTVAASAPLMAYNNATDVAEFNIFADTVIIGEPMILPGCDVHIHARRLEFRGNGCINTDALFLSQAAVLTGATGARGARGGNVSLFIKTDKTPNFPNRPLEPWWSKETWPADLADYKAGMYADRAGADGRKLISTRGGQGQKGGPGGTTRKPRSFGPVPTQKKAKLMQRLAETPLRPAGSGGYLSYRGKNVVISVANSDLTLKNWAGGLRDIGGGNVLRAHLLPEWNGKQLTLGDNNTGMAYPLAPLEDYNPNAAEWPPRDGEDAEPAGKPGDGGPGGDLSTTRNDLQFVGGGNGHLAGPCTDCAGGAAGKMGGKTKGEAPDQPSTYKVETAVALLNTSRSHYGWDVAWFTIDRTEVREEPFTLKAGKDAEPLGPAETGPTGRLRDLDRGPVPNVPWMHPLQVRAVVRYCRDLFLQGHREKAHALLSAYHENLRPALYPEGRTVNGWPPGWPETMRPWADALLDLAMEVDAMMSRLESSRDYFGNPVGWAPILSLASNLQIYNAEIDEAIGQLWFSYRVRKAFKSVEDAANELSAAANGLDSTAEKLGGTLTKAAQALPALITALRDKRDTFTKKKADLEAKVGALRDQAGSNEERKRTINAIFGIIEAASAVIPVGQPYLKAAGSTLKGAAGFFTAKPNEMSKQVETFMGGLATGLDTISGGLKPDSYGASMLKQFDDDLKVIETNETDVTAMTTARDEAFKQVDKQAPLFEAFRKARAAVSQQELDLRSLDDDIRALEERIDFLTRRRPDDPEPGTPDDEETKSRRVEIDKELELKRPKLKEKQDQRAKKDSELPALKQAAQTASDKLETSEERYALATKSADVKAELAKQKKLVGQAKIERAAKIAEAQRALTSASKALGGLGGSIKELMLPAEEVQARVDAELAQLQKDDPAYKALKAETDKLELGVTSLDQSVMATRTQMVSATRNWLENRTQAQALRRLQRTKMKSLDHGVLQHVEKMKDDAYERLVRSQYYIQKAYEHVFLEPCPAADYRLKDLTEKIEALLETAHSANLTENDFVMLRKLFRRPLLTIADRIIARLQNESSGRLMKFTATLSDEVRDRLNRDGYVRCNLVEALGLPFDKSNQRLMGISLKNVTFTGNVPSKASTYRLSITHLGTSLIRGKDALYCFTAGQPTQGGRATWGFSWNIAKKTPSDDARSWETSDILTIILGTPAGGEDWGRLSEFHPGILSDFQISHGWGSNVPNSPQIGDVELEVTMSYEDLGDSSYLLHVRVSDDLRPPIAVGYVSDPSTQPNQGGYGSFFRLMQSRTKVYVSAMPTYGKCKFSYWETNVPESDPEQLQKLRYEFQHGQDRVVKAVYDAPAPLVCARGRGGK